MGILCVLVGFLPVINSGLNEGFTSEMPPVTQTFHVILADHKPAYILERCLVSCTTSLPWARRLFLPGI